MVTVDYYTKKEIQNINMVMNENHYVYKITNTCPSDSRKYYIGVRSCSNDPIDDIGYYGSSKYLSASMEIIGRPHFRKDILSHWESRDLANREEIRLHELYDVSINPEFYNKTNATNSRFCTKGMLNVVNVSTNGIEFVSLEESKKPKYRSFFENVVNTTHIITGEKSKVTKEEYKHNDMLVHNVKGTVTVIDKINGSRKQVSQTEFKNDPNLIGQQQGRVNVIDVRDNTRHNVSTTEFKDTSYYTHITKGFITVVDISSYQYKKVLLADYESNDNYKSPRSNHVEIFNKDNTVMYQIYDNLKKFCILNKLPYNAFARSVQSDGEVIYSDVGSNAGRLKALGYWKYRGWYAKKKIDDNH